MTAETQQAVLAAMRSGMSLRKSCLAVGCAESSFRGACDVDPDLAAQYAHARADLIERMAGEVLDLADEVPLTHPETGAIDGAAVQWQRMRVDSRKWLLSKLAPKKYGDKIEVEASVKGTDPYLAALVALAKPPST